MDEASGRFREESQDDLSGCVEAPFSSAASRLGPSSFYDIRNVKKETTGICVSGFRSLSENTLWLYALFSLPYQFASGEIRVEARERLSKQDKRSSARDRLFFVSSGREQDDKRKIKRDESVKSTSNLSEKQNIWGMYRYGVTHTRVKPQESVRYNTAILRPKKIYFRLKMVKFHLALNAVVSFKSHSHVPKWTICLIVEKIGCNLQNNGSTLIFMLYSDAKIFKFPGICTEWQMVVGVSHVDAE